MNTVLRSLALLATTLGILGAQDRAPDFELRDTDGKVHRRSELKGVVVLEWTNKDCPFVQKHYQDHAMPDLAARYAGKGVTWLSIDSTHYAKADDLKAWKDAQKIGYPILLDPDGQVGRAYKAATTPHMFVVQDGVVVYRGAIDNAERGQAATTNHVAKALDEILAGGKVSVAETRPYGCSVKYAQEKPAPAAAAEWLTDYEKAKAEAKRTGRPILADFTGSDWCGWCVKLKKEVFDTEEFQKWAAGKVVLLELDFPQRKAQPEAEKEQNAALQQEFGIRGFPTVVFIDAAGKEVGRSGYVKGGPAAWIAAAEEALAAKGK